MTTGTVAREASRRDLLAVVARGGQPYYDEAADRRAQVSYYAGLDVNLAPAALFDELHQLVSSTHTNWLDYDAARHLYPWVDLRPSLRLQSIYSAQSVATDDPVRRPTDSPKIFKRSRSGMKRLEARMSRREEVFRQAEDWIKALSSAPTDAATLASRIALVEAANYFNCEHAVPQVLFDRQDPMRGDLHHLFTAERDINAVRSNRPLADFPEYDGKPVEGSEPEGFAPADRTGFEPAGGKGPMARAVLYFMVRYPWVLERAGELGYDHAELETLRRWSREDPPGLYEKHRNAEIQVQQGNRNPFVDHPEWVDRVDFSLALAS
ncbi:hypothetical protein DYH09_11385 [bacterium CPR1]|nr:hypothetical protein [bacterium CPR1]